ncbi:MAG: hypothetical protein ACI4O8_01360 [Aristaeellaceae bacterium]|nr:hypothetical protein [Eubacteriales bacterium]
MKKQKTERYARTVRQVKQVQQIYSRIGEPLPVEILIDLHQHLGRAMELAEETRCAHRGKRTSNA